MLTVKTDPRMKFSEEVAMKNEAIVEPCMRRLEVLAEGMDRINEVRTAMDLVSRQMPEKETEEIKKLKEITRITTDSLKALTKNLEADRTVKGLYRNPDLITSDLYRLRSVMNYWEPVSATQMLILKQVSVKVEKAIRGINAFFDNEWKTYRKAVEDARLSPFKYYEPLR